MINFQERANDIWSIANLLRGYYKQHDYGKVILPFRIKMPGENFFFEGNVSEIATLIEVNDQFVLDCAELVESVSDVIRKECPDYSM